MSLKWCANLSMLFQEVPFLERFALAAGAGFDAVEFLFPYQEGIQEIASRSADLGLQIVLFDIHPGDVEAVLLQPRLHPPAAGEVDAACIPAWFLAATAGPLKFSSSRIRGEHPRQCDGVCDSRRRGQ